MANVSQLQPALTPQVQTSSSEASEKDADFLALRLVNKRARLRLSPEPLDLSPISGKASLFGILNSKGWFAAVIRDASSASVLILSPLVDLRSALALASADNEQLFRPQRRVPIGGAHPHILTFACNDTRVLLGLVDGSIHVFASDQLLSSGNGPVQPTHVFTASPSAALLSIQPNPGDMPEVVAILKDCTNSPGSLAVELLDVQKFVSCGGWMAGRSPSTTPTAISWSPKGKQLALALQSGDVVTFSPTAIAAPKFSIPHPPSANGMSIISVHWLSTSSFHTIYAPAGQLTPDVEQSHFHVSLDSKNNSAQDIRFNNPYLPFPGLRPPGDFLVCLRGWDPSKMLLFIGDSTSSDIGLIGSVTGESGESWHNFSLEETSTPSLPLDKDQNDTILLGMDVDLTSNESYHHSTASGEALELPAHPVMYVYASDGTVLGWHVLNVTGAPYPGMVTAETATLVPSVPTSMVRELSSDMQTTPSISPIAPTPMETSAIKPPSAVFGQPSPFGQPAGPAKFGQTAFGFGGPSRTTASTPSPSAAIPEESMASDDAPSVGGLGLGVANSPDADSKPSIFGNTSVSVSSAPQSTDSGLIKPGTGFGAFSGFDQKSPFAKPSAFAQQPAVAFGATGFQSKPESSLSFGTSPFVIKPGTGFGAFAGFDQKSPFAKPSAFTPQSTTTFGVDASQTKSESAPSSSTSPSVIKPGAGFGAFAGLDQKSPFAKPSAFTQQPTTTFGTDALQAKPEGTPSSSASPSVVEQGIGFGAFAGFDQKSPFSKPSAFAQQSTTTFGADVSQAETESIPSSGPSVIKQGTGFGTFAGFDQKSPFAKPSAFTQQPTTTFGTDASQAKPEGTLSSTIASSIKPGTGFGAFTGFDQKSPFANPSFPTQRPTATFGATTFQSKPESASSFGTDQSVFGKVAPASTFGQPAFGQSSFGQFQTATPAFGKSSLGAGSSATTLKSAFPPVTTTPAHPPPASSGGAFSAFSGGGGGFAAFSSGGSKSFGDLLRSSGDEKKASESTHVKQEEGVVIEEGSDEKSSGVVAVKEAESGVVEERIDERPSKTADVKEEEGEVEKGGSEMLPRAVDVKEEEGEVEKGGSETLPRAVDVKEERGEVEKVSDEKPSSNVDVKEEEGGVEKISDTKEEKGKVNEEGGDGRPSGAISVKEEDGEVDEEGSGEEEEEEESEPVSEDVDEDDDESEEVSEEVDEEEERAEKEPEPLGAPLPATPAYTRSPSATPKAEYSNIPVLSTTPPVSPIPSTPAAPAQAQVPSPKTTPPPPLPFGVPRSNNRPIRSSPLANAPVQVLPPLAPSPAPTPTPTPEQGLQAECTLLIATFSKELENLKQLATDTSAHMAGLRRTSGVVHQRADLGDPRKWTFGDIEEYGKVLVNVQVDVKELKLGPPALRKCLRELDSNMLKVNTRKEEIARFDKARADAEFAKILKVRTLAPEYSETQSQLRKSIRVIRDRVQKLEDHLQTSKKRINELRTGRPSIRPPSLDTVNRTFRNIDIAIGQQKREVSQLRHRIAKLDMPGGVSEQRQLIASSSKRPLSVTPNVAVTTAAALNAERSAQKLKKALLACRTQPLLNTTAVASKPDLKPPEVTTTPKGAITLPTTPSTSTMSFPSSLPDWTSPSELGSPGTHDISPSRNRGGIKHHQKPIMLKKNASMTGSPTSTMTMAQPSSFEWKPVEPIRPVSSLPFAIRPAGTG